MKRVISTVIILLLLLSCDNFKTDSYGGRLTVKKDDFQGIDSLRLKGVIYDLKTGLNGFHGRGIIRLDIIESNFDFYDPRDKQANYYLIIKDGKAEVYEITGKFRYSIGDTVYIDVKSEKLLYYNTTKYGERKIGIGPKQFFRRIQEKNYQLL